jgi:phosphoglycerate dehydrogenase-like enzyme
VSLRGALESGQLGAAAIDVAETEPLPDGDPLWKTPNLIISPHVAGAGGTRTGSRIVATVV